MNFTGHRRYYIKFSIKIWMKITPIKRPVWSTLLPRGSRQDFYEVASLLIFLKIDSKSFILYNFWKNKWIIFSNWESIFKLFFRFFESIIFEKNIFSVSRKNNFKNIYFLSFLNRENKLKLFSQFFEPRK